MDNKKTHRLLPYEIDYQFLEKCRLFEKILLYSVSILSILMPFLSNKDGIILLIYQLVKYINILLIIAYYVLNVVTEVFIYPATAKKRRMGFVDNSFGSKYLEKQTENYYSNDAIRLGTYKMAVNCYECCFFTFNISKRMTSMIVMKNSVYAIIFITFAYLGLKDSIIAIPVLQILLSSLFITQLIHQLNFISKLGVLLDKFKTMFVNYHKEPSLKNDISDQIMLLLEYETLLAYNKAPSSNKIYKDIREDLTSEWEEIKKLYEIVV